MRRGTKLIAALVAALSCGALCAPGALAAPPANDNFADREQLLGPLPIAVSTSNVEATKEAEEPWLVFGKGRSIWYEWEAVETGFVTVGTCGTAFRTQLGVYTGTALNGLTPVADGFAGGPGCSEPLSGSQVTFKAEADTVYVILVDGDAFYLPPALPPSGEGPISLQVEPTPPPPNDDFAAATAITGSAYEEPGGPGLYFASGFGFNWGAGKEPGEPDHGGDPGGASVWFKWTAPGTGVAWISGHGNGFQQVLAVYSGSELGSLTPLAGGPGVGREVVAGETYWIAVDGKFDESKGEADTAQFSLLLSMSLPGIQIPDGTPPPVLPDTTPPETTLLQVKALRRKPLPPGTRTFAFGSNETPSAFRCRIDDRSFGGCNPPKTYRNLKPGRHKFEVVAVDAAGNEDPTPATARFRVPKPKSRNAKG